MKNKGKYFRASETHQKGKTTLKRSHSEPLTYLSQYESAPKGILELWEHIKECWTSITPKESRKLYKNMPKQIQRQVDKVLNYFVIEDAKMPRNIVSIKCNFLVHINVKERFFLLLM